ncbi:MAG: succinyl-diaminopimelate desuccinylase [Alphaproteobacteria bacterium]|nr:succinyl-diaminopimelate desuccinylase [Alphaproteobacteria bacterium]
MTDPVSILQSLIRVPSITPADRGAQKVLIDLLEPAGYACYPLEFDGVSCLFARIDGPALGPHFCFSGHTDVVSVGDEARWSRPPFAAEIHDGVLYGRGAVDMKGGVAAFAAAALAFGRPKQGSISFLIVGDEEHTRNIGTVRTLAWMAENGYVPDVCLVGEPTSLNECGDMIKIGRRGSLSGHVTVTGQQGHVAYPDQARNPLPVIGDIMHGLNGLKLDDGSAYFQPSNLEWVTVDTGNKAGNVTPAQVTATFNIRFNDLHTHESLEALLTQDIQRHEQGGITVSVDWIRGAESFFSPPGDFATLVQDCVEGITGIRPVLDTIGGSSDARFIYKYCPVLEFGPLCGLCHHVDERIPVDHLTKTAAVYRAVLDRYFSG